MSTTGRRFLLAFFLSGAAGVMHEVVWSRQLGRLVGAEAYAQALSLALFMGGLSLGALLARRRADLPAALHTYVLLELCIAGYALATPLLLRAAGAAYLPLAAATFHSDGARLALRFLLTTVVILPPAVMMGATLPLLVGPLARLTERQSAGGTGIRRTVGTLYAVNTAGALVGIAFTGFVILPALGVWGGLAIAAAANLLAAAVMWMKRPDPLPDPLPQAEEGTGAEGTGGGAEVTGGGPMRAGAHVLGPLPRRGGGTGRGQSLLIAIAVFITGLCAMGYEVLFIRVIALALGSSAHAFVIMLLCFIAGIALGSALAARLPWRSSLGLLGASQLLLVVAFLLVTPLLARLPYLAGLLRVALSDRPGGYGLYLSLSSLICLVIALPPTVGLGVALPVVADLRTRRAAEAGARVGTLYALGTAGNVLGVLLTALVVLPLCGLEGGFHLLWAANLAIGLGLLLMDAQLRPAPRRARAALVMLVLLVGAGYARVGRDWSHSLTSAPDQVLLRSPPVPASFADWKRSYVLPAQQPRRFPVLRLEHDAHNTVLAFGPHPRHGGFSVAMNGKTDASTASDLETQLLLGHAPMLLAPHARRVLVIGHGVGMTAGATLRHRPDQVDIVEISPAVLRVDELFANANDYVLADPRVRVHIDDGQSFLAVAPHQYDVIISEPSNPWIAGIGDLFTIDFFQAVRRKLGVRGVFTFWFHTYAQSDETTRLLLRTLGSVFPHAEIFADSLMGNVVAVASVQPLAVDFAAMAARFADAPVAVDLARIDLPNLLALLALHRASQTGAESLAGPGPVNTRARERLRFAGPRDLFAGTNSYFFDQRHPFDHRSAGGQPVPGLFERYLRHRTAAGDPVRAVEFQLAADWFEPRGNYAAALATLLRARGTAEGAPLR